MSLLRWRNYVSLSKRAKFLLQANPGFAFVPGNIFMFYKIYVEHL